MLAVERVNEKLKRAFADTGCHIRLWGKEPALRVRLSSVGYLGHRPALRGVDLVSRPQSACSAFERESVAVCLGAQLGGLGFESFRLGRLPGDCLAPND
ncbi:hypothetical protein PAMC26577_13190 [Caballeronia sordidicola]|uniref:Uncharacterized protein n=1 Tax=Caballeronia sordidicola TaxID=196367 RepID=A0A242MVM6_CABSO|nr:hypothetical protein PAMC26577_13190 [Caballeronia sordidicola]